MEPLRIPNNTETERFTNYLNLIGNERIIFSGIFGSGKTTFLKEYFKDREGYKVFHIYPTNYSVSRNEDIFELIKFDLLYEILAHHPVLDKYEPSFFEILPTLNEREVSKILKPFIEMIPKIGKTITTIGEQLLEMKEIFDKKGAEVKTDQADQIKDFVKTFSLQLGSIYENDVYTELINDLITKLKDDESKIILIVDDLDRIDPEHIFRILNVFAVHFNAYDKDQSENKFKVDQIILACDIDNVRAIFKTKYGQQVDFNGYIDKFYTREIFHFNNKSLVVDSVSAILKSIQVEKKFYDASFFNDSDSKSFELTHYILSSMILSGTLNLRTVQKLTNLQYTFPEYKIYFREPRLNYQIQFIPVLDFLQYLIGGKSATIETLQRTEFAEFNKLRLQYGDFPVSPFYAMKALTEWNKHQYIPNGISVDLEYDINSDRSTYRSVLYYITYRNETRPEITPKMLKSIMIEALSDYFNLPVTDYKRL